MIFIQNANMYSCDVLIKFVCDQWTNPW